MEIFYIYIHYIDMYVYIKIIFNYIILYCINIIIFYYYYFREASNQPTDIVLGIYITSL